MANQSKYGKIGLGVPGVIFGGFGAPGRLQNAPALWDAPPKPLVYAKENVAQTHDFGIPSPSVVKRCPKSLFWTYSREKVVKKSIWVQEKHAEKIIG